MGMELTGVKFGHPMIPSPPNLLIFIMALLLSSSLLLSGRALRQHVQHVTTTGPP